MKYLLRDVLASELTDKRPADSGRSRAVITYEKQVFFFNEYSHKF
jgi:hypothetical protein